MTDNNPMTTAQLKGQENVTSQIKHQVESLGGMMMDFKNAAVEGISGKKKEPTLGEQVAAAGEAMSADAAAAATNVDKAVKDNVTDPAAEALKAASEEVKP